MYHTRLARVALGGVVVSSGLWLACATIPEFLVAGAADAVTPGDGQPPGDGGSVADGKAALDATTNACANASPPDRYALFVTAEADIPGTFAAGKPNAGDEADRLCQERGAKINPCTPWKAVIATAISTDPDGGKKSNELSRIAAVPGGGWYQVQPDGGTGALLLGSPLSDNSRNRGISAAPILNERGEPSSSPVWVGNSAAEESCYLWTVASAIGYCGVPDQPGIAWLVAEEGVPRDCSLSAALYCAQQPR